MGTWDHKNFGNDDAMDFVSEVTNNGFNSIVNALKPVLETPVDNYLEAPEEQIALAAIEILAAIKGKPSEDVPEDIKKWINNNASIKIDESLVSQSQKAIKRILDNNSEIKQLWEESDGYDKWLEAIRDLEKRIS